MYMWTNRFYAEAFEWYEDLIQDPRKIKSETMWEWYHMFEKFILSWGTQKPECFWDACSVCFQKQYCHWYLETLESKTLKKENNQLIISGEEFPSTVYKKYGETKNDFLKYLKNTDKELINIPKCLWWTGIYQTYNDIKEDKSLEDYTYKYINDLYRKKSLRCKNCKHYNKCEWIHINFIRSYGFKILEPILWK
jgi:hypothetical protein